MAEFPYRILFASAECGNTPMLIGPYQCGKSQGSLAVCRNWWKIPPSATHTLFTENNDPITLGTGWPGAHPDNPLTFIQRIEQKLLVVGTDPNGALIIDEVTAAEKDQQRALSPIVLNRVVAGMPIECKVILCGNRPKDGSNEVDPQLAGRVQWIAVKRDRKQYQKSLLKGWDQTMGPAPTANQDWTKLVPAKKRMVHDYIDVHPEAFPEEDAPFDPDFPARPGPRTWDMGINFLAVAEAFSLNKKEQQVGLEGCVGRAHGTGYFNYHRFGGIPVKEIVQDTSQLKAYKDASPDKIDMIFEAVNAYMGQGDITGEDCGAFYAAAVKYDFELEMIVRHAKAISDQLPKPVREAIFAEITARRTQQDSP